MWRAFQDMEKITNTASSVDCDPPEYVCPSDRVPFLANKRATSERNLAVPNLSDKIEDKEDDIEGQHVQTPC